MALAKRARTRMAHGVRQKHVGGGRTRRLASDCRILEDVASELMVDVSQVRP